MAKKGRVWPFLLGGMLALGVGINVAMVVVATQDPSFAVEPDYYRKALAWDGTMAQEAASRDLGWQLEAGCGSGPADSWVVAALRDRDGALLPGATVAVEAFQGAQADRRIAGALLARDDRRYEGHMARLEPGMWELRFTATRGADTYTRTLRQVCGITP
jgi:nitrogen fixation protein FixH